MRRWLLVLVVVLACDGESPVACDDPEERTPHPDEVVALVRAGWACEQEEVTDGIGRVIGTHWRCTRCD